MARAFDCGLSTATMRSSVGMIVTFFQLSSAFASFCRAAEARRFPQLSDRDDLWRLLIAVTEHKAYNLIRDEVVIRLDLQAKPEA